MEKKLFRGVYTAMVTPFTKTDNIDEQALSDLVNSQIDNGISGLVPCGTSGECPTLSHLEHDRVIALTVHFARGRVPVIAGTGSNATSEAIQLSRHAQTNGADACLLVNPYYNKPTQKGLYLHFKAVAESVDIPCILYNIKGRTGVNLETHTLCMLANDCPNIIGVKEASGNLVQMEDVIKRKPEGFSVLSGDDNLSLDLIERGGDGVVSVASNIAPKLMSRMVSLALSGKMADARAIEAQFAPFFKACFIETNPIPIKTALARYGWCAESFRLPLCTLESEEHRAILYKALDELDAIGAIVRR
jgi:4-hydroxy-tetrahydrodipicolinate synthase